MASRAEAIRTYYSAVEAGDTGRVTTRYGGGSRMGQCSALGSAWQGRVGAALFLHRKDVGRKI
jgi:hypothetical protein